jgi:hypothetical protein
MMKDRYPRLRPTTDLKPGMVVRLAPRYDGGGTYVHNNGAGELLRLIRPMTDGADWYVTADLDSPLESAQWSYVVHVDRLCRSELI